jgi:hypothetical protein
LKKQTFNSLSLLQKCFGQYLSCNIPREYNRAHHPQKMLSFVHQTITLARKTVTPVIRKKRSQITDLPFEVGVLTKDQCVHIQGLGPVAVRAPGAAGRGAASSLRLKR